VLGDLSNASNVRKVAREVKEKFDKLDCLINNAGVFMPSYQQTTGGQEMTFAVNVVAPYLLSSLLKVGPKILPHHRLNQPLHPGPAGQVSSTQADQHQLHLSGKDSSTTVPAIRS